MLPETHYPVDPDPATIAERARIIQRLRRRHGKSIPAAALDAAGLPSRTGTGRVVSASRLAILDAAQRIAAYGAPVTLAALLEELGLPVRERGASSRCAAGSSTRACGRGRSSTGSPEREGGRSNARIESSDE